MMWVKHNRAEWRLMRGEHKAAAIRLRGGAFLVDFWKYPGQYPAPRGGRTWYQAGAFNHAYHPPGCNCHTGKHGRLRDAMEEAEGIALCLEAREAEGVDA